MTARQVVTLNETTPQLEVPQTGDTYTFPVASHFAAAITTDSTIDGRDVAADGALAASALQDVVDDTTPQLGGNMDVNGKKITSASNGDIDIEPNGTGNVLIGNYTFDADQSVGAGQDNYVLTYDNGTGLVTLEALAGGGDALTANPLSQFAATTSAQLAGVLSDETGTGAAVFASSPTLVTPALGTPSSGVATNLTGTASSLTAGNVTTNANLTGHVTSTGNAAVLGSFTVAQLNTALSDATLSGNNTGDQVNITGNAATVTTNANLTGHVTSTGNAAVLGSFTLAQLNTAVSDGTLVDSAITASSSDTLTNKTFDANGTGNSLSNVDVADLANGTDGELITWDAAGAPAVVATGTATHVLTSNGAGAAPTFQAVAGGSGAFEADADTQITPTTAIVLDQATGNEIALDLSYTTNKASSGNDTGLLINQTDTASPGASLLVELQVGGVSLVNISNTGKLLLDANQVYGTSTGIWFGDGDVGIYELSDDALRIKTGLYTWRLSDSSFRSPTGGGAEVSRAPGTVSAPVYTFASDLDTGMFKDTDDQLAFAAGGVEAMRFVEAAGIVEPQLSQGTNDAPFINFLATADADATSAISTLTTSGSTTHHIQVEINGTTAWIACSTTDPS